MSEFFNYQSPYRTNVFLDLNLYERIIPILIIVLLGFIIYKYRDVIRNDEVLDKKIRYSVGGLWIVLYSSHFLLRFALYGFDTIVLPFHLCSISMFFGIILMFTNNRTIFSFVMMTGIAGGLISLAFPILGYNASYYRYYQFMFAHGILVLVPFYYMFVYGFMPTSKEIRNAFIILQVLAIFMMVFNYFMDTDFMFLFFDKSKIDKFPAISMFGGIPYYIILVEFAALGYFFLIDRLIRYVQKEKEVINLKNT